MKLKINQFASPAPATVNSYWLETDNAVILIDAQRAISQATELLAKIAETQKPMRAIFLSHPHPDHFGGLSVLAKAFPEAPIYASREAYDNLRNDAQGWIQKSKEALGEDFEPPSLPTDFIKDNDEIVIDNVGFRVDDVQAGESEQLLMFYLPEENKLFCSDLVQNKVVPFLLESNSAGWLKQLETVEQNYSNVEVLYPGHGASGSFAELINWQREYLQTFRQLIANEFESEKSLTDQKKQAVVKEMQARYPNLDTAAAIPNLLDLNVDAIIKEFQKEKQ